MSPSGWIILVPIALPNVAWALFPRQQVPAVAEMATSRGAKLMGMVENAGRVALMTLPIFLELRIRSVLGSGLLWFAALALALYYGGWCRYFLGGREPRLLYASLGPIPVPLAVAPVLYFLAFAVIGRSALMAIATVLFGLAHIPLSLGRAGAGRSW